MPKMCDLFVARWIRERGQLYDGDATQAESEAHLDVIRSVAWQSAAHVTADEIGAAVASTDEIRPNAARIVADAALPAAGSG
ncbi:MAG: hypothetical protein KBB39_07035 [Phycicoccus sp.]|nr:hypothetical protein [Phycicoccus sp.]